jgi:hypothetical protein
MLEKCVKYARPNGTALAKQKVVECGSEGVRGVGPIRRGLADQAETTTSNVAARCIGDDSDNKSGYCLHTGADMLLDVGIVLGVTDTADLEALWTVGDGEKGGFDAATDCTPTRHTAKWKKVGEKGEREGTIKDAGDLLQL